ncbi:hypothetical protein LSH36_2g06019 [Paralvinella palmiformis]|uniref:Uncharacterized protein n=1 Tax=Paralvinella palmiformis TaxID=53620 RepID=A0AAD9KG25_9ANNE|nr:hypothetical protein LSH36_2g06019 [Paralvinella palmiformis]
MLIFCGTGSGSTVLIEWVLRPPGGGDSNIFGSDEPPIHTQKRMAPQPPSNDIFGPPTSQNVPARKWEDTDEEKEDEATQNNNGEPSFAQPANTYAKPMQQGSYNPITGQGGEDQASTRDGCHYSFPEWPIVWQ